MSKAIPAAIIAAANEATATLLPQKSKQKYEKAYMIILWNEVKKQCYSG